MNLLIKYPTRGRPERFFAGLDSIYQNIFDKDSFHVCVTIDDDDTSMSNLMTVAEIMRYGNISVTGGISKSKVDAINRDMPTYDWDVLMVFSDDMRMTFWGFDKIIKDCMDSLDLHLCLPEQDEKGAIPVLYIAGRAFYNRFGFIYPPEYKSLFCDVEMMDIAKEMGLYKFENIPSIFEHLLPAYGRLPADEMWLEQQKIGWTVDQKTYLERKSQRLSDPHILDQYINAYKDE